tara:strand:+ start:369 stop:638 length:270 start_codon:yes stop_codon:yes gene_type:complete
MSKEYTVKKIDIYKDGGTTKIVTNRGTFYIDKRLKSKTKYAIYDNYPDRGNKLENDKELKKELYNAMNGYNDTFYQRLQIEMVKSDLKQ